jgi:hypothetical protein
MIAKPVISAILVLAAAFAAAQERGERLKPGEFRWTPERSPSGPVVVLVSLPEQVAYVYRNGIEIGMSTVSSGKPGHETPAGVFTILEKDVDHHSSTYDNAPMPYQERLTWDGVALHAGRLPGYPASHGCVRLPYEFSKLLFGVTSMGGTVVVADAHSDPVEVQHPGMLLPHAIEKAAPGATPIDLPPDTFLWAPDRAPAGPVAILLSGGDRRVYVYRNGELIGEARIAIDRPEVPLGMAVYTLLEGFGSAAGASDDAAVFSADRPRHRWHLVALGDDEVPIGGHVVERVRMPRDFAASVYEILEPGATLMVTDRKATEETTTEADFTVMATEHPDEARERESK